MQTIGPDTTEFDRSSLIAGPGSARPVSQPTEVPPEFAPLLANPESHTCRSARRFGVTPERFASWRWQMAAQVRDEDGARGELDLDAGSAQAFSLLNQEFNAGITPYYAGLMSADPATPCPIRIQALPSARELVDPLGLADPLRESGQSPVPEVIQIYPDRVAFCVAQLCPVYCRYCFRKRRDGQEGLHYNRRIIEQGLAYIRSTPAIRDVLITGGDPFIASDDQIVRLATSLRAIPHVEIIRFGTRTPVTLPYRITRELAGRLAGLQPIYINTHFNCAEEITPEATLAVSLLVDAGIPVGNQAVLLRGVNDTPERMLALCRALLRIRVRPYYLFHPHAVKGTEHLRVPVSKGLAIMKALRGNITGLAIPSYVIDTPSGKIPLLPESILGTDGDDLILATARGGIWRERGVMGTEGRGG